MTTVVKTGSMVLLGLALTLGIKNSNAQEQIVKAANVTEVVSAGSEVKPVIVVPEKLVKAMEAVKDEVSIMGAKKKETKTKKAFAFASNWYELIPTTSTSTSTQIIASGMPIAAPLTGGGGCAQNRTTGSFCAIHLAQPVSSPIIALPDSISVQAALAPPYNYTLDTNEDGSNHDGYSRQP